ncbi:hypothetical protein HDU84_002937 [Entophlyctis sp. JEL0112]|nr:hypothetical protein HDU84_002937 [Entophlyctis sp. JEL0112]
MATKKKPAESAALRPLSDNRGTVTAPAAVVATAGATIDGEDAAPVIKSVGASISLGSQTLRPQKATLMEAATRGIGGIDATDAAGGLAQGNAADSAEGRMTSQIPIPTASADVIVKRIERNPNSRREAAKSAAAVPPAAQAKLVQRRVVRNEPTPVTVVTVAEGNIDAINARAADTAAAAAAAAKSSSTRGSRSRRKNPAIPPAGTTTRTTKNRAIGDSSSAATTAGRVRFAEVAVDSTVLAKRNPSDFEAGSEPTSILRKSTQSLLEAGETNTESSNDQPAAAANQNSSVVLASEDTADALRKPKRKQIRKTDFPTKTSSVQQTTADTPEPSEIPVKILDRGAKPPPQPESEGKLALEQQPQQEHQQEEGQEDKKLQGKQQQSEEAALPPQIVPPSTDKVVIPKKKLVPVDKPKALKAGTDKAGKAAKGDAKEGTIDETPDAVQDAPLSQEVDDAPTRQGSNAQLLSRPAPPLAASAETLAQSNPATSTAVPAKTTELRESPLPALPPKRQKSKSEPPVQPSNSESQERSSKNNVTGAAGPTRQTSIVNKPVSAAQNENSRATTTAPKTLEKRSEKPTAEKTFENLPEKPSEKPALKQTKAKPPTASDNSKDTKKVKSGVGGEEIPGLATRVRSSSTIGPATVKGLSKSNAKARSASVEVTKKPPGSIGELKKSSELDGEQEVPKESDASIESSPAKEKRPSSKPADNQTKPAKAPPANAAQKPKKPKAETAKKPETKVSTKTEPNAAPPTAATASTNLNSRLQRSLRLRARLKLEVDGVFAMGLCAPTEQDLSPPSEIPESLMPRQKDEPEPESPSPKVFQSIPDPLPISHHIDSRRAFINSIGYPATGWMASNCEEKEVKDKKVYKFRRSQSLEDATTVYNNFLQSHPLPFGHYENYNDIRVFLNEQSMDSRTKSLSAKPGRNIPSFEDAMIESFGFPPAFGETVKRPKTAPTNFDRHNSANGVPNRGLRSAQSGNHDVPAGKHATEAGSVRYLQQFMDRMKKPNGAGPTNGDAGRKILHAAAPLMAQQLGNVDAMPLPRRPAPPPMLVRDRKKPAATALRHDHTDECERYSDIVSRRNGWDRSHGHISDGAPIDTSNPHVLLRGRTRDRARVASEVRSGLRTPALTARARSLGRSASRNRTHEEERVFGDPFGLPSPRRQSPLKVVPKPVSMDWTYMRQGQPNGKLQSLPARTSKAAAGKAGKPKKEKKPLKPLETETGNGNSESQNISSTSSTLNQPWLPPWMNMFGYLALPQAFDPNSQQSVYHLPWAIENNQIYPDYSTFKHEPPPPQNTTFTSSVQPATDIPLARDSKKAKPTKSVAKHEKRREMGQLAKPEALALPAEPVAQDPILPVYNPAFAQSQSPYYMPPFPNLGGQPPIVPPHLLPARIRMQQVPVVVMQQAMVIEPTGGPPGSLAFAGAVGTELGETAPTFINSLVAPNATCNRGFIEEANSDVSADSAKSILLPELREDKKMLKECAGSIKGHAKVRDLIKNGVIGRRAEV